MKENQQPYKGRKKQAIFAIWVLIVFAVLSLVSITLVQNTMLKNADVMGKEITRSFSVSEDANIYAYELLLKNASQWLDKQLQEEKSTEDIAHWMEEYLVHVKESVRSKGIDMYAAIHGKIVAANYWEGDDTFDPTQTEWYQLAIAAEGEIIYTNAYPDVVTGSSVVTMALRVGQSDTVLAIDLFPEYFQLWASVDTLPPGSSFFLCDPAGTLLFYETPLTNSQEEIQEYILSLIDSIEDSEDTVYIQDLSNKKRAVYHRKTLNGWTSIITIPYSYLVDGLKNLVIWYGGIFISFLVLAGLMYLRESRLNRQIELTNETVRVLGNSYYAIYRINFDTGRYTMLKGSDYIRTHLEYEGDYFDFLRALENVIEKDAYADFIDSFSLDSIRKLVTRKVRDYGGDFLRLFNGEYRWVNVRLLFDESLNLNEAVLCFREVDEEKQRQLQHTRLLKESLAALQKSTEAKNMFFAGMSHDMRTPLNAIIGLSELAEHHLTEPDQLQNYLQKINTSSKHLLGLINDILDMSKLEQGKLDLENNAFLLQESIVECVDVFRIQAKEQQKKFTETYEIQNNHVVGDLFRIQQILNNLLSNAIKFTKAGDSISISVRQLDDAHYAKYQFTVQDTGCGMTEEFLQKIFVPFERETRFGAKNVMGTGLGMPIVHHIVLQMDGDIHVESKLGSGTTFTVTLPLNIDTESESEPAALPQNEISLAGRRILLAEDNEINMEIATELLQMQEIEVTQAWNGREALELFRNSIPGFFDAILMDMQMPEMNGCDAARAIRSLNRPDAGTIPIIAVTANAFAEDIAATTSAGMNAHISKPIDFAILQQTLTKLLKS
ncbi:MAG: ATP-binding protein [Candidatus Merdivicinus sp.]